MTVEPKAINRLRWLPLASRMLVWSLTMMCLWGWFPFLFGGGLGLGALLIPDLLTSLLKTLPGETNDLGRDVILMLLMIPLVTTCVWMLAGAITGALTGFYAPTTEPNNPFKSSFFRTIGRQTFWFWFLSSLVVKVSFFLLGMLEAFINFYIPGSIYLYPIGVTALFIVSVRRALHRALTIPSLHSQ